MKQPASTIIQKAKRVKRDAVRTAARKVLSDLMNPISGFIVDSGLSFHEMQTMLRVAIVRSVYNRQRETGNRVNISGIAASTGIPRSEISKILRIPALESSPNIYAENQATNRILSAWHEHPAFTTPNGQPAEIPIYGRGNSFETLVKRHGGGIPARAMLDELVRAGAVEVLSSRRVRARSSIAINRGISVRGVKIFGQHASELLSAMITNMRRSNNSDFVASIEQNGVQLKDLPLYRKEVASKGGDFLAALRGSLFFDEVNRPRKKTENVSQVNVTIFYHESPEIKNPRKRASGIRRNYRRLP